MTGNPWSKFFWSDWESDEALRQCSLAAQGLWMRMLCICAKCDRPGYLTIAGRPLDFDGVAKATGADPSEVKTLMDELDRWGVFSRDRKGRIYSRRMVREAKRSQEGRKHIKKRWSQKTDNKEKSALPNRGPNRDPTTHKPESRRKEDTYKNLELVAAREADDPLEQSFKAWWERFPKYRAGAKGRVKRKWFSVVRRKQASVEELNAGLDRYLAAGYGDSKFACGAEVWLNGEKWTIDDFPPATDAEEKKKEGYGTRWF